MPTDREDNTNGANGRPATGSSRQSIKLYLLCAGLLILAAGAAIWLVIRAQSGTQTTTTTSSTAANDAAAVANVIAQQCAMGRETVAESSVTASLAKYLSGLTSGSKVSTSDVGALVDKITPNDSGVAFYKAYTDCLKQQAAILLSQRGVQLVAPSPTDIEHAKDLQTLQSISELNPQSPKSRLLDIFGPPIASGSPPETNDPSMTPNYDMYQYKHMAFAIDYTLRGRRIGLVLATKDPLQGSAMFFEQIRDATLGGAEGGACGGITITAHTNGLSGICTASHASNYVQSAYFFYTRLLEGTQVETNKSCSEYLRGSENFPAKKCPGISSAPALAIIIAEESVPEKEFKAAIDAFASELDFGGTLRWRSASEQKEMDSGNEDNIDAAQHAQILTSALRTGIVFEK